MKPDIPLNAIRAACEAVGEWARHNAFASGTSVCYVKNGRLVRESRNGQIEDLGVSSATDVEVESLVWKWREE